MRTIDREIILEITSRNIQQAFKKYGLGPNDAAEALADLFSHAREMIARGGSDYQKGIHLLKFCYEKLESFWKHVEGTKIDLSEQKQVEMLSGEELDSLLKNALGD